MTSYDTTILATTGLVGYWPMDDVAGTGVVDSVSANNGTRVNAPTTGVDLGFTETNTGMIFIAATPNYITIPNSAAYQFGTGDFSLECWFSRSGDPTVEEQLFGRGVATTGGHGFEIYLGDGGRYLTSRIGAVSVQTAFPGWADWSTWHHVVVSMTRASSGIVYIDGASSGSANISGESAFSVSETATMYIARTPAGAKSLTGGVAKVALYNVALSSGTVAAHYAARLSGGTSTTATAGLASAVAAAEF